MSEQKEIMVHIHRVNVADCDDCEVLEKYMNKVKILFLGYDECRLLDFLRLNHNVIQTMKPIKDSYVEDYDVVISFGYRYLLSKKVIANLKRPAINLHISFLPWNRGANPNYWSFYENTPKGITIHEIDENVDTGPIIYQKEIVFVVEENTLKSTYQRLINDIQDLFILHVDDLLSGNYSTRPQIGNGSYHVVTELELSDGWDTIVTESEEDVEE